jgi:hypothetical protein
MNANYLIAKKDITGMDYLAAPYANVLYVFDEANASIWEVSTGFLIMSDLTDSTNITVTGKSTNSECSFVVQLLKQTDSSKIVVKQNITSKHFKTEPGRQFSINLEDIYGGPNLRYSTPASTDKVQYTLEHMNQYKANYNRENVDL